MPLFDAVSAEAVLNVTFPPQEMANETDTVVEGQGLRIKRTDSAKNNFFEC